MANLPRVSVCLLTYRRAHLLPKTLEYLLAQDHGDFELIVNDDCSPDHTEQVCREFARRDSRVRYVRNTHNLRYADNQNAAILRASCEHVAIVHDGDVYYPNLLREWTRALLEQPTAALAFSAAHHMDAQRRVVGTYASPYGPCLPGRALFEEMLSRPDSPIFGIVMLRRSRVLQAGPFDPRLPTLGDVDMWLRLLLANDAAYVPEPLYAIAPREAGHHNTYSNWRVRAEAELIYELNWRRGFAASDPQVAERTRRRIARLLAQQRALALSACARHAQFGALAEGVRFSLERPPFGASLAADTVTDWQRTAERVGVAAPLLQATAV